MHGRRRSFNKSSRRFRLPIKPITNEFILRIRDLIGGLVETVYILTSPEIMRAIREAEKEIAEGKYTEYKSLAELEAEFETEK